MTPCPPDEPIALILAAVDRLYAAIHPTRRRRSTNDVLTVKRLLKKIHKSSAQ